MQNTGYRVAASFVIVLVTSVMAGAFLSRFLAENLYNRLTIFFHWMPTILLVAALTLLAVLVHCLVTSNDSDGHLALRHALSRLPLLLLALYLFQRPVDTLKAGVLLVGCVSLVACLEIAEFLGGKWLDRALLSTIFLLPFALYFITVAPTVGEGDTFEFQVLSHELGIAHPTGYPLYILIGKLFTFLPLGNVAYRVNVSSALFAAATVVVLYGIIYQLTARRSASLLAALSFAFTYSFWSQAVVAEVYALNALFVALTSYLLLRWLREEPAVAEGSQLTPGQGVRPMQRKLSRILGSWRAPTYAIAFIYGLSLSHHRTMVLLAPAALTYALVKRPRCHLRSRNILLALTSFAVPLLGLHLYIPLRWWQIHGRIMTWAELTNTILGTQFAGALQWDALFGDPHRLQIYVRILLEQYPAPALGLALLGLLWLFWPKRPAHPQMSWKEGLFLLTAFVAYVLFGLIYYVPDVSLFIIPSYLFIAVGLGVGLASLCQLGDRAVCGLSTPTQPLRRSLVRSVVLTAFGLLPLSLVWLNLAKVDRSGESDLYNWGKYVLQQELPSGAVILADSEKIAPLHYLQRVERMRADTESGVFPDEESYRAQVERRLSEGRPVLLARFLPGLEGTYHLRSIGPLVEVSPHMQTELPPNLERLECNFGNEILLQGYRLDSTGLSATHPLRLTLYWQAKERVSQNYDVRLRLLGSKGHVWQETRGRPPVNGLYPTAAWRPGEIVPDFHQLDLPADVPPGKYALQLGLFPSFSQERFDLSRTTEHYLPLTLVSVSRAAAKSPTIRSPLRAQFDSRIVLLGYDLPRTAAPGGTVTLTLYWQRIGQVSTDYDLALELAGPDADTLWQNTEPPLFGEYPTSQWDTGRTIADSHTITIPQAVVDHVQLRMSLLDPETHAPVPVISGWLSEWQSQIPLPEIQILDVPLAPGRNDLPVNFENKFLLLDYEVRNVQVRQGQALQLGLTWQDLTSVDEDYTVFVHLLDANERMWGQQDTQPVYGTHPTSQWKEGEIIEDAHTLWTDEASPLGLYRIEVGLYLLRTMERLQVLDASGKARGDRVLLGPVEIVP